MQPSEDHADVARARAAVPRPETVPRWNRSRRTALRPFFSAGRRSFARAAAQEKSPALARRWGFIMNMELESFATAFQRRRRA